MAPLLGIAGGALSEVLSALVGPSPPCTHFSVSCSKAPWPVQTPTSIFVPKATFAVQNQESFQNCGLAITNISRISETILGTTQRSAVSGKFSKCKVTAWVVGIGNEA